MKRLPYEYVIHHAFEIYNQAALAPDWKTSDYLRQYYIFIFACGWTDFELRRELMIRIDAAWEPIIRHMQKVRNIKRFN